MVADDLEYLEHRAEAEIALAQNASDARVVNAHYQMATAYLDRLHGGDSAES